MNYAIFVMRQNTNYASVCYVASKNFATRIYSATELLKATNIIVWRHRRIIMLQDELLEQYGSYGDNLYIFFIIIV